MKLLRPFFSLAIVYGIILLIPSFNLYCKDDARNIVVKRSNSKKNIVQAQGEYKALLIGISDYTKCPKLETPINDIKELKRILTAHYGFKRNNILSLENHKATRSNIEDALFKLTRKLEKDESLLIYFAGHGQYDQTGNLSWWVPVDGDPQRPGTMIAGGTVRDYIKAMKARHILTISDSCFAGSLFGTSRALPPILDSKFYEDKYFLKSRWGFTSGNMTPVSDLGGKGHSIFAEHLFNYLEENKKPYLVTSEIYIQIAPVIRNNSEQLPICKPLLYANDCGGEFVFFRSDATLPIETQIVNIFKPPKSKSNRFVDNGDGTITDTITGLIWQKDDSEFEFTFKEANRFCSDLKFGGINSWRLPTNQELKTLYQALKDVGKRTSNHKIAPFHWRGSYYWSSTKFWNTAYILSFETGKNKKMGKSAKIRVRAVSRVK